MQRGARPAPSTGAPMQRGVHALPLSSHVFFTVLDFSLNYLSLRFLKFSLHDLFMFLYFS